jgi:YVTN family beta-propeller protein
LANRSAALALMVLAALPARADLLYVTNQSSSDLSIIDTARGEEVARLPVPGNPAGVAVSDALGAVFVVATEGKRLMRFSLRGDAEGMIELDGGPIAVAVDARRGRVFVSDWFNARIWVIDAASMSLLDRLSTGAAPSGLALSPDGRFLAVAERDADRLRIFDAETLASLHAIPTGLRPFGVSFAPDGRVVSADVGSNTVTMADPATGRVLGRVPTGERPYGVAFAQGLGFVTNQYADSVTLFDATTLEMRGTIEVGEYPEGIDTSADGRLVFVANWFSNTITVIDVSRAEVLGEIATGDGPRAFGHFATSGIWEDEG